jgi:hypothetical protein
MNVMRKLLLTAATTMLFVGGSAMSASAAPLPDNCTKTQGTVTCTTFDGPGNNQGGVGSTTTDETQGNTTNKSPETQQDLANEECGSQNPPNAKGGPIACP